MKSLTMIFSMLMMFVAHAGCDIFTCSKSGILDTVKMFVEQQGVDVNASDEKGFTPLHYASLEGQLPVIEYLISKGSDLEAEGKYGRTPLHLASWNGHQNVVKYLLSKGSNIEAKDKNENSPLLLAANKGNLSVIESLVESGANIEARDNKGRTSLHRVTARGYLDAFNYLLSHGANIKATDDFKDTPLHYASLNNMDRLKFIEILLSKGSNIEEKDKMGLTPFLSAAWGGGTKENLQYLISKGANLNARDNQGNTALHLATETGGLEGLSDIWTISAKRIMYLKKIKFLLSQGLNIEGKNDNGETPLHKAADEGNFVVLKSLVLNGAQVNPQNNDGKTPLHLATSRGYWGPITFLISRGADKNIKDNSGLTALDYALKNGNKEIILILEGNDTPPRKYQAQSDYFNTYFWPSQSGDALAKMQKDVSDLEFQINKEYKIIQGISFNNAHLEMRIHELQEKNDVKFQELFKEFSCPQNSCPEIENPEGIISKSCDQLAGPPWNSEQLKNECLEKEEEINSEIEGPIMYLEQKISDLNTEIDNHFESFTTKLDTITDLLENNNKKSEEWINWIQTKDASIVFENGQPQIALKIMFNNNLPGVANRYLYYKSKDSADIKDIKFYSENLIPVLEFKLFEKRATRVNGQNMEEQTGVYYKIKLRQTELDYGLEYLGDIERFNSSAESFGKGKMKIYFPDVYGIY